ncbi:hypothetical protein AB0C20_20015, partial [Micromonospora sp. NPDC048843]
MRPTGGRTSHTAGWSALQVKRSVADLRAAYGRYPADPAIRELVTELLGTSPRLAHSGGVPP